MKKNTIYGVITKYDKKIAQLKKYKKLRNEEIAKLSKKCEQSNKKIYGYDYINGKYQVNENEANNIRKAVEKKYTQKNIKNKER